MIWLIQSGVVAADASSLIVEILAHPNTAKIPWKPEIVALLTYVIIPLLTRLSGNWLFEKARANSRVPRAEI